MRLIELDPQFIKYGGDDGRAMSTDVDGHNADGIMFLCPKCYEKNGGRVGTHRVICNRPRVPQRDYYVGPGRWEFHGTGLHDLTLKAGSSSVLLSGGCNAHFFIERGSIRMA